MKLGADAAMVPGTNSANHRGSSRFRNRHNSLRRGGLAREDAIGLIAQRGLAKGNTKVQIPTPASLRGRISANYAIVDERRSLTAFLTKEGTFHFPALPNGLFPAASSANRGRLHGVQ